MAAFYNEYEPFPAAWLRELIKAGEIHNGEVCEKDMWDVVPSELAGFEHVHLCAGIGGWSEALRLAGWPDTNPVWTVSLPCQPFSAAGKGAGLADERGQLAEAFFWLAGVCRPNVIFGEQVEAAIKHDWWDVMGTSLESIGYTVGAVGFPASSCGAFHIRQRLYWCAVGNSSGMGLPRINRRRTTKKFTNRQSACGVADSEGRGRGIGGNETRQRQGRHADGAGILGDSGEQVLQGNEQRGTPQRRTRTYESVSEPSKPNFWSDAEWIYCRDGKARPTKPGLFPLAHGVQNRVGTLRGAGNAIVPQQAANFIKSFMEIEDYENTK